MREEQKRNELPAENALVMKPAFAMAGNTLIPEICIAITNGDFAEKPVPANRSGLSEGTMSPAMKTPRM